MAIGLGNLLKIGKTLTSGALDSDAFAEMLAQLGMDTGEVAAVNALAQEIAKLTSTNTVTVYVCGTGTPSTLAYNVAVF